MDKQKIVIIGMAIAIFVLAQYLILEKWQNVKNQEISENFQNGYNQGVKDTLISLYKQTEDCHTSTAVTGNLTKQYVDFNCLKSYLEELKP